MSKKNVCLYLYIIIYVILFISCNKEEKYYRNQAITINNYAQNTYNGIIEERNMPNQPSKEQQKKCAILLLDNKDELFLENNGYLINVYNFPIYINGIICDTHQTVSLNGTIKINTDTIINKTYKTLDISNMICKKCITQIITEDTVFDNCKIKKLNDDYFIVRQGGTEKYQKYYWICNSQEIKDDLERWLIFSENHTYENILAEVGARIRNKTPNYNSWVYEDTNYTIEIKYLKYKWFYFE